MPKIILVSKNILDSSKIITIFENSNYEVTKMSGLAKLLETIDSSSGKIIAAIDFELLTSPDDLVELVPNSDDENIELVFYGPHELMNELSRYYPDFRFVARSLFFRDPIKHTLKS